MDQAWGKSPRNQGQYKPNDREPIWGRAKGYTTEKLPSTLIFEADLNFLSPLVPISAARGFLLEQTLTSKNQHVSLAPVAILVVGLARWSPGES